MTAILSILARIAPYLIAAFVGAGAAHYLDANHYGAEIATVQRDLADEKEAHGADMEAMTAKAADAARAALAAQQQKERDVAALDAKYSKERNDAKAENDALRAAVADGSLRLRFAVTSCTATSSAGSGGVLAPGAAASVDPGTAGTAELDRRDTDRLFSIASRGDAEITKLRAAQEYIKTACVVQPK
jgi:hypothetical protein